MHVQHACAMRCGGSFSVAKQLSAAVAVLMAAVATAAARGGDARGNGSGKKGRKGGKQQADAAVLHATRATACCLGCFTVCMYSLRALSLRCRGHG